MNHHKLTDDVLAVLLFPVLVLTTLVRPRGPYRDRVFRRVTGANPDEWGRLTRKQTRIGWAPAMMSVGLVGGVVATSAMFLVSAKMGILLAFVGGCLVAMGLHIRRRRRVLRALGRGM